MKPSKKILRKETTTIGERDLATVTAGSVPDLAANGAGSIKRIGPTPQPPVHDDVIIIVDIPQF